MFACFKRPVFEGGSLWLATLHGALPSASVYRKSFHGNLYESLLTSLGVEALDDAEAGQRWAAKVELCQKGDRSWRCRYLGYLQ